MVQAAKLCEFAVCLFVFVLSDIKSLILGFWIIKQAKQTI